MKASSAKRRRRHDLPTPESPIRTSLKRKSGIGEGGEGGREEEGEDEGIYLYIYSLYLI